MRRAGMGRVEPLYCLAAARRKRAAASRSLMPDIPAPTIYLRNRFSVRGSHCTQFLAGKELLLRSTQKHWKLLAGCGNRSLKLGQNLPEPALHFMQVWE